MRRRGLWAACVILLVGVGVLVVGTGFAKDENANDKNAAGAKCSEATLHGRYLFAYDGVEGKKQAPRSPWQDNRCLTVTEHNMASLHLTRTGRFLVTSDSPARIASRRIVPAPSLRMADNLICSSPPVAACSRGSIPIPGLWRRALNCG